MGARLVGLVFDADVDGGIMRRDLTDAIHLERPERRIVTLEGVVEPVLAEPERHQHPAGLGHCVDATFRQIDGLAAHRWIRVGESPGLERGSP